ncbi:MAG TPA: ATP-binding protein [Clostridia bacterium]|nr:ATP-binding protein [Clostridia bacterium]HQA97053.1 ATP-binding protein [Clostridia bacterium]HQO54759.1 ATP-binding protein [Clostridia bacterium]HUM60138.1 ATP-binding protein [Clostridia bacterium]
MKRKIMLGFIALILAFGSAAVLLTSAVVQSVAREQLSTQLAQESKLIATYLGDWGDAAKLEEVFTRSRVTLIAPDGTVLFDNWTNEPLDNHMDRPEIRQALTKGQGSAVRYSDTTRTTAIYVATLLEDGNILRVAAPERIARGIATGVAPWLIFGLVIVLLVVVLFANFLGDKLIAPILAIDPDHPEEVVVYDELLPLIRRIDAQNRHNRAQMEALEARRLELNALLDGMQEGFIALSDRHEVSLINPAACRILEVKPEQAHKRLLTELNRSLVIIRLLDDLEKEGVATGVLEKSGRHYLLAANRIQGRPGSVLLMSDQTDKLAGEAMRKRFTANVSHELRTPLTTIFGYAELLEKGMVKEEDAPGIYQLIHKESSRMLDLVEDILRLSSLDEGYLTGKHEKVSLRETADAACRMLSLAAQERGVKVTLSGEDAFVLGDPVLLGELLSNLLDNAIKYNVENGSVDVRVTAGANTVLSVSDTGIGIEPEHQLHVFERFYRTDNCRSKSTGGTGLGLSIVKHAAEYHKAKVDLISRPGQGTRVTVVFPSYSEDSLSAERSV